MAWGSSLDRSSAPVFIGVMGGCCIASLAALVVGVGAIRWLFLLPLVVTVAAIVDAIRVYVAGGK